MFSYELRVRDLRLSPRLSTLGLRWDNLPDHILPHIVLLAEVEHASDLAGALRTPLLGDDGVGEAGDLSVALLDDLEGQHSNIGADDATTDRLAAALAIASGSVAGVVLVEKESDTVWDEHALLHGEALLVVATGDAEDVALEFVSQWVTSDFLGHPLFVEDTAESARQVVRPPARVASANEHTIGAHPQY